jgi:hypothetical protein
MRNITMHSILLASLITVSCKKDFGFKNKADSNEMNTEINTTTALTSSKMYFISPLGDDNNNGISASTPWKTLSKVNATAFSPGDVILFEGGQTFAGSLYITSSGTSGFNIKFASYGSGRAIINGGSSSAVFAYNSSYIFIDSLILTGGWNAALQSGNDNYGALIYNDLTGGVKLGEVTINHCEVKGFAKSGIGFLSWPADGSQSGYSKITAMGNTVHDNGACGISTLGPSAAAGSTVYAFPNVYVGYNRVYNNMGVKANTSGHSGDGILIGDASGGTIEYNVAYNNGWYCTARSGGPAAIWCYDSRNLIFQHNEAHHNGTGTGTPDGDGFDLDGGSVNCIMQYNYSHDNYGAGFLLWEYGNTRVKNNGNTLRYNISQNDNTNNNNSIYGGISVGPNCTNNLFYNNSIWSIKGSAVFVTGGTGNKFYNNIFESQGTAPCIVSTSGSSFLSNNYYNANGFRVKYAGSIYTALVNFRNTGNEKYNSINYGYSVNPQLNSPGTAGNINTGAPYVLTNYLPVQGSPMINTALNLLTTFRINVGKKDFRRNPVPYGEGYDIGACEWR